MLQGKCYMEALCHEYRDEHIQSILEREDASICLSQPLPWDVKQERRNSIYTLIEFSNHDCDPCNIQPLPLAQAVSIFDRVISKRSHMLHKFEVFAFVAVLLATKLNRSGCDASIISCLVEATGYRPISLKFAELKELELQFMTLLKGDMRAITAVEVIYRVLGSEHAYCREALDLLRLCHYDVYFSSQAPSLVAFAAMQCVWSGSSIELNHYAKLLNIPKRQSAAEMVRRKMLPIKTMYDISPRKDATVRITTMNCTQSVHEERVQEDAIHSTLLAGVASGIRPPADFVRDEGSEEAERAVSIAISGKPSFLCDEPDDLAYLMDDDVCEAYVCAESYTGDYHEASQYDHEVQLGDYSDKENAFPKHMDEKQLTTKTGLHSRSARNKGAVHTKKIPVLRTLRKTPDLERVRIPQRKEVNLQVKSGEGRRVRYRQISPTQKSMGEQIFSTFSLNRTDKILRERMLDGVHRSAGDIFNTPIAKVA